jgi:putative membrane protein
MERDGRGADGRGAYGRGAPARPATLTCGDLVEARLPSVGLSTRAHDRRVVNIVANVAVGLVALIHAYFLVLEMFLWTRPQGIKVFGTEPQFARDSAVLAANQGLYNGFLAAGLLWGIIAGGSVGYQAKIFFLACVVVAGLYGGATANRKILVVQALPAGLALALVFIAG